VLLYDWIIRHIHRGDCYLDVDQTHIHKCAGMIASQFENKGYCSQCNLLMCLLSNNLVGCQSLTHDTVVKEALGIDTFLTNSMRMLSTPPNDLAGHPPFARPIDKGQMPPPCILTSLDSLTKIDSHLFPTPSLILYHMFFSATSCV
jgi:hypothetical protein